MIQKVEFRNGKKQKLYGYVSVPKKYNTAVVFLHGFPSSVDGSSSKWMMKAFSKSDYLFMTFDFSCGRVSEGNFSDKLMSQEVKDIKCAIDFLEKLYGFEKLFLIGHSTGAIDAALYSCKDKRLSGVVLSGGVADLKRAVRYDFNSREVHSFWTKGYVKYDHPGKWYDGKKISKAFYDEFFTLDIASSLKKYKGALMVLHGSLDEPVPVSEAYELLKIANRPKKLVVVKGADHRFSKPEHLRLAVKAVKKFIKEN